MNRYICLIRFTDKGAQFLKESTKRAHEFDEVAEKAGVKIEGQYWTVGTYDGVLILSSDDPKKALRCLAELAATGNVRTDTMQAFTDCEFDDVLNS